MAASTSYLLARTRASDTEVRSVAKGGGEGYTVRRTSPNACGDPSCRLCRYGPNLLKEVEGYRTCRGTWVGRGGGRPYVLGSRSYWDRSHVVSYNISIGPSQYPPRAHGDGMGESVAGKHQNVRPMIWGSQNWDSMSMRESWGKGWSRARKGVCAIGELRSNGGAGSNFGQIYYNETERTSSAFG